MNDFLLSGTIRQVFSDDVTTLVRNSTVPPSPGVSVRKLGGPRPVTHSFSRGLIPVSLTDPVTRFLSGRTLPRNHGGTEGHDEDLDCVDRSWEIPPSCLGVPTESSRTRVKNRHPPGLQVLWLQVQGPSSRFCRNTYLGGSTPGQELTKSRTEVGSGRWTRVLVHSCPP